jgi:signal peptidase I
MYPTIIIGDWLWIDKTTYGARLPRRFAEIPLFNVFTWLKSLRIVDEKNDWGNHRFRGKRMPRVGDLAVFESPDFPHLLLVKRIAERYKKGDTIVINANNYYNVYHIVYNEGHQMKMRNDSVFIDGKADSVCIVSQPYYYMLGDNRNNSADSRVFGYIPYSSIVGRMSHILFSINTNKRLISMIRWDRFFKRVE